MAIEHIPVELPDFDGNSKDIGKFREWRERELGCQISIALIDGERVAYLPTEAEANLWRHREFLNYLDLVGTPTPPSSRCAAPAQPDSEQLPLLGVMSESQAALVRYCID